MFNWSEIIGISLLFLGIFGLGFIFAFDNLDGNYMINNIAINVTHITHGHNNGSIEYILEKEISLVNLTNETCEYGFCKCWDYANYYNKTLSEKYPELDIRWIRYVDICNNFTVCKDYHTFLVVSGFRKECILDQHYYTCL